VVTVYLRFPLFKQRYENTEEKEVAGTQISYEPDNKIEFTPGRYDNYLPTG
jgi:hypothetical protein